MKTIILITIFLMANSVVMAGWWSKEEPKLEVKVEKEIIAPVLKECFYKMGGKNGYGVLAVYQETCSGMRFVGKVINMEITEYDENMVQSNKQTPRDKVNFDKKIKLLWPTLQGIRTSP